MSETTAPEADRNGTEPTMTSTLITISSKISLYASAPAAYHHKASCPICGAEVAQCYRSEDWKRLGRGADYHPSCKVVANSLSALSAALEQVEFANGDAARRLANSLFQVYQIPNNIAHAARRAADVE